MIDILVLLKIFPVFLLALASPGPDFMIVSAVAISRGKNAGIRASAGIATGVIFYTALSMMGFGELIKLTPSLIIALKVLGGFYLMYLGKLLWKMETGQNALINGRIRDPYSTALLTNITNPKAILFFISLFSLVITPVTTLHTKIAIITLMGAVAFIWFCCVALIFSHFSLHKRYARWQKYIDRVAAVFLFAFGVWLIVSLI